MKATCMTVAAVLLAFSAGPAVAHEVPNMSHTHAFESAGYGQLRKVRSVNNELGSIRIVSPPAYQGYTQSPPVRFARPEPITRGPNMPIMKKQSAQNPALDYGSNGRKDYGD